MLRKSMIVFAIAVLLESSGLITAAVARGKDSRSDFGALNGDHFALGVGTGRVAIGRYDGRGARVHGLRPAVRPYDHRDVWGHWGMYYGPMIAVPF